MRQDTLEAFTGWRAVLCLAAAESTDDINADDYHHSPGDDGDEGGYTRDEYATVSAMP